jgi:hypothetical protein
MDIKNLRKFSYSGLDSGTSMIRLVRLSRAEDSTIVGELKHFSLDSPACPKYATLSYVWGEKRYSNAIILDGYCFPILENLYPVLEAICDNQELNTTTWWWIDSICINQDGGGAARVERGFQVQLMERIYRQSERTVGWLGKGSEGAHGSEKSQVGGDGEDAMNFLYLLLKNRWMLDDPGERRTVATHELGDRAKWAALERLLLRPWWKRVWTLQEYIIPSKFVFYCGTKSMDRDDLKVATYSIYLCRKIDPTLLKEEAFQPLWNRRRLLMWYREAPKNIPLVGLIAYGSDSKATDPKDRIYSLLGLAQHRGLAMPDYNLDIKSAYTRLVKSFVETHKSLDIICFAHLFHQDGVKSAFQPRLPSWVPDWRVEASSFVAPVMASQSAKEYIGNFRPVDRIRLSANAASYAAAGDYAPDITFSDDLQSLKCRGILIDYVDGIGGLNVTRWDGNPEVSDEVSCDNSTSPINLPMGLAEKDNLFPYHEATDPDWSSRLIDDISRCLVLNRKDRYLTYPAPPNDFCRDFLSCCRAATRGSTDISNQFGEWFQLNKSLLIRGHSLEDIGKASNTSGISDRIDWLGMSETSFLPRFKDTTKYMERRLITTNDGHIGMAPCRVRKGDQICVLFGCNIPLILRQRKNADLYEVIGECYLHGFMDGEALGKRGNSVFEDFVLL